MSEGLHDVDAGPDLAFGMPEIEGYPSAQPYSAVQQLMQDEMQDAVNASASEHGTSHAAGKASASQAYQYAKTLTCSLHAVRRWLGAMRGRDDDTVVCLQIRNNRTGKVLAHLSHCQHLQVPCRTAMPKRRDSVLSVLSSS